MLEMTRATGQIYEESRVLFESCRGLNVGRDDLPEVAGKLLVDAAGNGFHGQALEEGMPWRWGDGVEPPAIGPYEADGPFEIRIGRASSQGESE